MPRISVFILNIKIFIYIPTKKSHWGEGGAVWGGQGGDRKGRGSLSSLNVANSPSLLKTIAGLVIPPETVFIVTKCSVFQIQTVNY